jgi:hypothetical protein
MITGHARWASTLLVPTRRAKDGMPAGSGSVGRFSRSFDCQLEVVPVDLDLT